MSKANDRRRRRSRPAEAADDTSEPENGTVQTELLADPSRVTQDLVLVNQAISGRWEISEQLFQLLPARAALIVLGRDTNGRQKHYSPRDKLRACETILKMVAQNATIGRAAGGGGSSHRATGPTLNAQINVGVGGQPAASSGPPWIVATQQQVAGFFGNSLETIKDWREKGMPGEPGGPNAPGRYDLSAILRWRDATIGPSGRNETGDASRSEADRRRAWAEAQRSELELAVERGQVAPVADMLREWSHAATHARALLEQVPDRLLAALPPGSDGDQRRRFRDEAEKAIDAVVRTIHEGLKRRAGEVGMKDEE